MCLKYEFNFDSISEIHFQEKYKTVSSAYIILQKSKKSGKSFLHN